MDHIACLAELIRAVQFMGGSFPQSLAERNRWARRIENGNRHVLLLIAFCGEVWETPGVFQRAVGRMRTRRVGHQPIAARQSAGCPWPWRLSAVRQFPLPLALSGEELRP